VPGLADLDRDARRDAGRQPIGVGRQNGSLQGVTPNTPAVQNITANGIVVTRDGNLVVADTARGALWDVRLDSRGRVTSPVGCDETFPADTLCLDAVRVEHPALEGADGIALDAAGRIWVDANERNTIAVVDQHGTVTEFFRNPAFVLFSQVTAGVLPRQSADGPQDLAPPPSVRRPPSGSGPPQSATGGRRS
jgi:sugar lactone lactonase YvrE